MVCCGCSCRIAIAAGFTEQRVHQAAAAVTQGSFLAASCLPFLYQLQVLLGAVADRELTTLEERAAVSVTVLLVIPFSPCCSAQSLK
jgi:hypothetical protein